MTDADWTAIAAQLTTSYRLLKGSVGAR